MLDAQTKANEGLINDPDDDIINKMADMSLAKPSKYFINFFIQNEKSMQGRGYFSHQLSNYNVL